MESHLFILESRGTKVPAQVFALLWMLASSSFCSVCSLFSSQTICTEIRHFLTYYCCCAFDAEKQTCKRNPTEKSNNLLFNIQIARTELLLLTGKKQIKELNTATAWGPEPHKKNWPHLGAVARVFPNISLAMCPLKLSFASYLLDSWASTD